MKRITAIILSAFLIAGLCACEKPAQSLPLGSFVSIAPESKTVEGVEEDPFSNLPEDARKIAEFTGVYPDEYEDIRDLDYYVNYVESMYDIPHWKAFGTAAMIIGYEPAKTQEQVVKYLNNRAPRGFTFLFEAFFYKKYAKEEMIEYVQSYAYYLTKATLENHSFAEFAENDYREEWYKAVGCTREYDYDEYDQMIESGEHKCVDGITMLQTGKHTWKYGGESWIENAQNLYDVIYDGSKSFDAMEEEVKADAPVFFEKNVKGKYAIVELVDDEDVSLTRTTDYGGYITLSFSRAGPHEYIHALTVRSGGPDTRWICEGIADYYSVMYKNGEGAVNLSFTEYMNGNEPEGFWEGMEPSEKKRREALYIECREIFNAYKEKYGDKYSEDLYAYLAVGEKEIEEGENLIANSVRDVYSIGTSGLVGKFTFEDSVSYYGACILVGELIKDFGAEKVLLFLKAGGDFKTEFGMTSSEYLEMVRERGGYKLSFFDDTPYNN